jgi:hypothetical protein
MMAKNSPLIPGTSKLTIIWTDGKLTPINSGFENNGPGVGVYVTQTTPQPPGHSSLQIYVSLKAQGGGVQNGEDVLDALVVTLGVAVSDFRVSS